MSVWMSECVTFKLNAAALDAGGAVHMLNIYLRANVARVCVYSGQARAHVLIKDMVPYRSSRFRLEYSSYTHQITKVP